MFFNKRHGFTFVEILMTLAVIGILFIPVTQLFNHSIFATANSLEMITAANLANSEMEKTINLNLPKVKLKELGTVYYPPLEEEPLVVNQLPWRVERQILPASDPVEIRINVYHADRMEKPMVTLVTLVEDMMWESVKPVGEG